VFFDFFDRVIIAAKGGVFTFLSFPKKKGTKENCQGGLGADPRSKAELLTRSKAPFPLGYPLTPHLERHSLTEQRGSCYAFPSMSSAAFICRYTHEDGWYPNNTVCFFGIGRRGLFPFRSDSPA